LTKIAFFTPQHSEAYLYEYDDSDRINTEKWISVQTPSHPIRILFYRYDSLDRLTAKETNTNSETLSRKDTFQYFYNENGTLSEVWEFDTQFGYSIKDRKNYIYGL
jgi:hypothetical protein